MLRIAGSVFTEYAPACVSRPQSPGFPSRALCAALPIAVLAAALTACGGASADQADPAAETAVVTRGRGVGAEPEEAGYFGRRPAAHLRRRERRGVLERDGQKITFQSTRDGRTCDQQYVMNADGSAVTKISAGRQDHLRLLLRQRHARLLRLLARGRQRLPAAPRSVRGLRVAARRLRHLHRRSPTAPTCSASPTTASTPPRASSPPTASRSSSRRSRTATSTSTR